MGKMYIGLTGYSRCGKDTAANALIERGFTRINFGDEIKAYASTMIEHTAMQFEAYLRRVLEQSSNERLLRALAGCYLIYNKKIDPFTEVDEEKTLIREFLEEMGMWRYNEFLTSFMNKCTDCPTSVVNTKILRLEEAFEWKNLLHGHIIRIQKENQTAATFWEHEQIRKLHVANCVDVTIQNDSSIKVLQSRILEYVSCLENGE